MLGKRACALVAVAVATCLLAATPAPATFPGANGRIAFSQADLLPPIGGEAGDLSAHSDVFTIEPNGSGLAQLTHVGDDQAAGAPDWSPGGQEIVYESNESGGFAIWKMDADGSNQTQLTDESGFEDFLPSWSPDGNQILFSRCAEPFGPGFITSCDIDSMNKNGGGVKTILSAGNWNNVRAEYSPDGNRIAFSSDRSGLQSAVWVMDADGTNLNRLTRPKLRAFWPDWGPSGKRILFSDHCCIPHSNLWSVRPEGGGLKELTHVPRRLDSAFASYSPDGKRIVTFFSKGCRSSPCSHFFTFHADGSHHHKVATGVENTFLTDWGPAP